jgi:membrane protein
LDQKSGNDVNRIWALLKADLWQKNHPLASGRGGRHLLRGIRVLVLAGRSFLSDECPLRATALAYSTILSIVPLMAVAFSLAAAFPGLQEAYESVKALLYQYLAAGASDLIIQSLDGFIGNIHSGAIAGLGTSVLLLAVILLLAAVETAFNKIWGVTEQRRIIDRLVYYVAIVIIGPLLLGISLKTIVTSVAREFAVFGLVEANTLNMLQSVLVPLSASAAAFTVLYVVIPNKKVFWPAGLAGGILAGILFELAKRAYTLYATRTIAYSAIYGTMAAIPIFLIWIYVIWLIILFGAEVAYAWQNLDAHRRAVRHRDVCQCYREWLAVSITAHAVDAFGRGEAGPTAVSVRDQFDLPGPLAEEAIERLTTSGILTRSDRGCLPARDPQKMTLADIMSALRAGPDADKCSHGHEDSEVSLLLSGLEVKMGVEYGKISLDELASSVSEEPVS